jgi:hypothetical protein
MILIITYWATYIHFPLFLVFWLFSHFINEEAKAQKEFKGFGQGGND